MVSQFAQSAKYCTESTSGTCLAVPCGSNSAPVRPPPAPVRTSTGQRRAPPNVCGEGTAARLTRSARAGRNPHLRPPPLELWQARPLDLPFPLNRSLQKRARGQRQERCAANLEFYVCSRHHTTSHLKAKL